jgi:hypothetical protein
MRLQSPLLLAAAGLLAACSTTIETRRALAPSVVKALHVEGVEAASDLVDVTPEVRARLVAAVRQRLEAQPQGATSARVLLTLTQYDVISAGLRAGAGAIPGASKATMTVRIVDGADAVLADFDVKRSFNPGGYGMFFDQQGAMIDALDNAVADVMAGRDASR